MGRSFDKEIENLEATYQYSINSNDAEVFTLSNFIKNIYNRTLFIVGSGGSYSTAKAIEFLHGRSGIPGVAKAVTPLELFDHVTSLREAGVILITANGNNNDTVSAYNFIIRNSPYGFLCICLNEKSKIKKLTDQDSTIFVGQKLPGGKDGYLAVNSVLAIIIMVARAYKNATNLDAFSLPKSFSLFSVPRFGNLEKVIEKESKIVLFSDYATPIAIDIESKFSEAALGNIMMADYRNFAHGRHFWLSQRASSTAVISLVTPTNRSLYLKTIDLFPHDLTNISIETTSTGVVGMIELYLGVLNFISYTGKSLRIDPGKPNVPDYGRKMYHISYTPEIAKLVKKNDFINNRAAFRKCCQSQSALFDYYVAAFKNFKERISRVKFTEIVFDFDATLKERELNNSVEKDIFKIINTLLASGIIVKIATGRGKSVRIELREQIHKFHWDNVIIGYYNGGVVAPLSNETMPDNSIDTYPALKQIACEINNIDPLLKYDLRPQQLTIMLDDLAKCLHKDIIIETSRKYDTLKAFLSGHSIDIIPKSNSKLHLADCASGEILSIGDSGEYLGNDYELLSTAYSLSVNRVSVSPESCWNYAPLGLKNTKATLYYLNQIQICERYFTINMG